MTLEIKTVIPTLRIFDEAKAREFYLDFLGFESCFEHRFGENFPLYMGVSLGGAEFHLSEHHGDASPGANLGLLVDGLDEYRDELVAKRYKYARPEIEETDFETREMTIGDPFGNKLRFFENVSTGETTSES